MKNVCRITNSQNQNYFGKLLMVSIIVISIFGMISCEKKIDEPEYGNIKGIVLDLETGEPISSVLITTDPNTINVSSDRYGIFEINTVDIGDYNIVAYKLGYKQSTNSIKVRVGEDTFFTILLEKDETGNHTGNPIIKDGLLSFISFDNEIKSSNPNYVVNSYNVDLTNDRNGNPNSAGSFTHYSKNSVQINNLPYSITSYTISFWINPESYYGYPYLGEIHIAGRYGYLQNGSMKISYEDNKLLYKHNNNGNPTVNTNQDLITNTWTHITLTYESKTYTGTFYINGVKKHSTKFNYLPSPATTYFAIGMDAMNGNRVFNGKIDEFYLFNRAITENEVLQLYGN